MPTLTLDQANQLVSDTLNFQQRHAGYQRTVELRAIYETIIYGRNYQDFLGRYKQRETDGEFAQRLALTYQNLTGTSSPILRKGGQISRVQDIKKGLNFSGTSERDQRDLQSVLDDFGGTGQARRGSLDDYLTANFDEPSQYDPNAFILLDFEPFNANLGQRARPYGVFFDCVNVYNFRYTRGNLDYLLLRTTVQFRNPDGLVQFANDLMYYGGQYTLRYFEVLDGRIDLPSTYDLFETSSGKQYHVVTYVTGIPMVPAVRIGDLPDPETGGLTCVSRLFHAAIDQFRELINLKSQNDIVGRKYGFPRRYERTPECPGEVNAAGGRSPCDNGTNLDTGQTCRECGGYGYITHKSEQDTVTIPIKENEDPAEAWDLSKLSHTEAPQLEGIKTYDERLQALRAQINVTVFASDQQIQAGTPSKTATEYVVSREDQNNTLLPIADYKSSCYKLLTYGIIALMQISGEVEVLYEYPRDLKLSSMADLYADLKAARDAKAPSFEIEQILDDIARKRYESDPTGLRQYFVKKQHIGYYALDQETFAYFDSTGRIPVNMGDLLANVDIIFGELEIENPTFYDLPYAERNKLVDAKLKVIQEGLPRSVSMSPNLRTLNSRQQQQEQQTA